MKWYFLFTCLLFFNLAANASIYDRKIPNGTILFQALLSQGVPKDALDMVFRMFDYNHGNITNTDYAVIVDYSQPSTIKRFYLMNFNTGAVEKFYVAHGINSGVIETRSYSNIPDSLRSSLGFFYAKGTYDSAKNGISLYLDGIDRSNDNARLRNIVVHGAKYVSDSFIAQNGRLGWSEGCFAVGMDVINYLVSILQNGSILLSYHKTLLDYAHQFPKEQELKGNEILPAGVNLKKTPDEGGEPDDGS